MMALAQPDALTLITLTTSAALDDALNTDLPVLLLIWNGESLRSDVKTELEKAAREQAGRILVVKADASQAPEIGERYELGKHPLLIGWLRGEVLARRSRPWNTDVQGMVEMLLTHAPAREAEPAPEKKVVNGKPVKVTDKTFEKEVIQSDLPVLVDFWAEWCGPCKQVAPILDKLSAEFAGTVKIAKVDVDANPGLTQAFRIMSIPTMMFVKNGKIVGQQAGALPEHILRDAIQQLVKLAV
jgi:thioredoxin 1